MALVPTSGGDDRRGWRDAGAMLLCPASDASTRTPTPLLANVVIIRFWHAGLTGWLRPDEIVLRTSPAIAALLQPDWVRFRSREDGDPVRIVAGRLAT